MDLKTLKETPPWNWPKDARRVLLKILRDEGAEPSDRLMAADLAGDFTVIDNKLAGALLAVLKNEDEPEKLRSKTAVSLGPILEYSFTFGLGSDDSAISQEMADHIKESLHGLYTDPDVPKEVRRRVLEVSVRVPQDWHADAVREAYLNGDEDYRLTAIFCMGFIAGFDNEIMQAMESHNPAMRHEAVKAAGNWQVDTDWLDIDSPLISGEDDNSLFQSAIKTVTGIRSTDTDYTHNLPDCANNDEFLDTLHDVLTMDDLPWDDEFIETDEDDDDF